MRDFHWCGVKQESYCLYYGSGGVELDADSKFAKQDRMRSQKNRVRTPLLASRDYTFDRSAFYVLFQNV